MKLVLFSNSNQNRYKEFTNKNAYSSIWQTLEWKSFQEHISRKVLLIGIETDKNIEATALIIKHPLPLKKCWLEIPRGPLWSHPKACENILKKIYEIGKKEDAIFARVNPLTPLEKTSKKIKHKKAFYDHHPETTLILDLTLSEEELLKQMKPKGRYNIKVAKKHGVEIVESKDATAFHLLLQVTTDRDGFTGHNQGYYQNMIDTLGEKGKLYYAKYENSVIAGGIFTFEKETATYYYGASGNQHRNLMASYLLQWHAIKEAQKRNCAYYDFLGIAPENTKKDHPWNGVTTFKKKFGGEVISHPKAQDIIIKPLWYTALKAKKKLFR